MLFVCRDSMNSRCASDGLLVLSAVPASQSFRDGTLSSAGAGQQAGGWLPPRSHASPWVGCQVRALGFDAGKNSSMSQGEGL